MKYITLQGALRHYGSKKKMADAIGVAPSMVSFAFQEAAKGREYKVRTDGTKVQLVRRQDPWHVVKPQGKRK